MQLAKVTNYCLAFIAIALALSVFVCTSNAKAVSKLAPYSGLGSWIELYDGNSFNDPVRAVVDLKMHGVKTLYLETGNYRQRSSLFRPDKLEQFIQTAHAQGIKVVAWYLPSLENLGKEFTRVMAAINFRTRDGQKFDSFALDIESSRVKTVAERNKRLLKLSARIRAATGKRYALGAITPSPLAMAKYVKSYWPNFPYKQLDEYFDVFLPMDYFTYRSFTRGNIGAYDYTTGNIQIIREQTGDFAVPIHIIGGLSTKTNPATMRGFVQAVEDSKVRGASLYQYRYTSLQQWSAWSL